MEMNLHAQKINQVAKVEPIIIDYNGSKVRAKKLTVHSEISKFKSVNGGFPKQWEVGQIYGFESRVFGIIPFGGIHYLFVEKIDDSNYMLSTKEWDSRVKVWNHLITIRKLDDGKIYYEDSITIYAGIMTGFITSFAKRFYKHRQKRWQIVAKENLNFGQ
jgi:hypothetical protein